MHNELAFSVVVLGLLVVGGCARKPSAENEASPAASDAPQVKWVEENIDHHGAKIALGFRGDATDDGVEPVASITRDEKPVAGAMVFVTLVPATDEASPSANAAAEVATLYEAGEGTAAIYTPGRLPVPQGDAKLAAKFRIMLPDAADEFTRATALP